MDEWINQDYTMKDNVIWPVPALFSASFVMCTVYEV